MASQGKMPHRQVGKSRSLALPHRGGFGLVLIAVVLAWGVESHSSTLPAEAAKVRFTEGLIHAFLTLRTLDGTVIADGDEMQVNRGDRVTSQLIFHFKDGSLQDETTVFSQAGHFRLLSDRLVQKGPAFKHPLDVVIDASTGAVTVHSQDDKGKEKVGTSTLSIPPDLANGMIPVLLMNMPPGQKSTTASMIVATPKPIVVTLAITAEDQDSFLIGSASHKANRYDVKVEIPGIRGAVAPLVGKQPPDTHVWILAGSVPVVVKSEGPFCEGCPVWRTELASPVWPNEVTSPKK
jgi:hypothetical protein